MWLIMTKSCGNGLTGRVFEEVFGKNSERILDPIKQIHYIDSIGSIGSIQLVMQV